MALMTSSSTLSLVLLSVAVGNVTSFSTDTTLDSAPCIAHLGTYFIDIDLYKGAYGLIRICALVRSSC